MWPVIIHMDYFIDPQPPFSDVKLPNIYTSNPWHLHRGPHKIIISAPLNSKSIHWSIDQICSICAKEVLVSVIKKVRVDCGRITMPCFRCCARCQEWIQANIDRYCATLALLRARLTARLLPELAALIFTIV